jgi:hypothetical protein
MKQYVIHVKVVVGEQKKNKVDFPYKPDNHLKFKLFVFLNIIK